MENSEDFIINIIEVIIDKILVLLICIGKVYFLKVNNIFFVFNCLIIWNENKGVFLVILLFLLVIKEIIDVCKEIIIG